MSYNEEEWVEIMDYEPNDDNPTDLTLAFIAGAAFLAFITVGVVLLILAANVVSGLF